MTLTARVKNGRLVLDEPTELPEGAVLELELADAGDNLDSEERQRLHAALERSVAQAQAGELIPAEDVMAKLRAQQ